MFTAAKSIKSRVLAVGLVILMVLSMVPVGTWLTAFAANIPSFSVKLSNVVGDTAINQTGATVTLTDTVDNTKVFTKTTTNGVASFVDTLDDEKTYKVAITGVVGFKDFTDAGVAVHGQTSYTAKLTEMDKITVSGTVTDEKNTPYPNAVVAFTGYSEGSTTTDHDGKYSFQVYKDQTYAGTITAAEKYKPISLTINTAANCDEGASNLAVKTFVITTAAGVGGIITASSTVNYGDNKDITVKANEGYKIKEIKVNGTDQKITNDASQTVALTNITKDQTISATFEKKTYTIAFTYNANGTITYNNDDSSGPITSGGSIQVTYGKTPEITITPSTHYHVGSLKVDNSDIDLKSSAVTALANGVYSYQFASVKEAHSVSVEFMIDTYDISVSSGSNGTVTIGGQLAKATETVNYGAIPSFVVTPSSGYSINEIKINSNAIDVNDSHITPNNDGSFTYTFPGITANSAISASFEKIPETTGDESTYYNLTFLKEPLSKSTDADGTRVYVLSHDAAATFSVGQGYSVIKVDGASDNFSSNTTVGETKTITGITVKRSTGPFHNSIQTVAMKNIKIVIDKTAPIVNAVSTNVNTDGWKNSAVTVSATVTDTGGSDLSKVVWSKGITMTDDAVLAETANIASLANGNYSFQTDDTEQNGVPYYVYAVDKAGNVSEAKSVTVNIDKTKPEITGFTFSKLADSSTEKMINFLTFGIFYKESINVTVTATDSGTVSSGLHEIILYADGTEIGRKAVSGNSATFTIAEPFAKSITAQVTDGAGNGSDVKSPTDLNTAVSSNIMLESVKPTVTITPTSTIYTKSADNTLWSAKNIPFDITVADANSGVNSVVVKVNGQSITTDKNGKAINAPFGNSQTKQEKFVINTDQNPVDGANVVEVTVTDNAGNELTTSKTVYKDTVAPEITGFEIKAENDSAPMKVLNFLTFGVFFNEKTLITVTAVDTGASAGIDTITLFGDGTAVGSPAKVNAQGKASFEVDVPFYKVLSAVSTDKVGNITAAPVMANTVNSNIKDSHLMLEKVDPTVAVSPVNAAYFDASGNVWRAGDTAFNISAGDADSGIRSVEVKINNALIPTDKNGKAINADFYKTKTNSESFVISTDQGAIAADGSYIIAVTVTDNAGNVKTVSKKAYKDIGNPYITHFDFESAGSPKVSGTPVQTASYGYFFPTDTKVTVTAEDDAPASGVQSITYYTVDYTADKENGVKSAETTVNVDGSNQISFIIPANFKGQIYAKATDHVNNTSDKFVTPSSTIEENAQKHAQEEHIAFSLPNTADKDNNGLNLYSSNTNVSLTVTDTYSGLKKVEWSVSAPNDQGNNQSGSFEIKEDSSFADGGNTDGWAKSQTERNLVTKMTKSLAVSNNSNAIQVWVKITDRAGNTSEKTTSFSIDKTAPTIAVTYDNNTYEKAFAGENQFYKANRTATVVITERNFNPADVLCKIANKDGAVPKLVGWTTSENNQNPDKTTHTATIQYTSDGDYTFDISCTDSAGNSSGAFSTQKFVIDKTNPTIHVAYDNNNAQSGNYYKATRTATITIREHNFETSRVKVTGTAANSGNAVAFPRTSSWTNSGDVHTATITYSADAKYTFNIAYTDKAGNAAANFTQQEFYVDKTAPAIKISGVANKSANKGDVIPVISFSDTNYSTGKDSITLTGAKRGKVTLQGSYSSGANGQVFTFQNFEKTRNVDDIYTLTATLTDKAGNTTTQSIMFSVNRFGSVYSFSASLKAIDGKYIKKLDDIILTETNVDNLNKNSSKVKMTKNGTPYDLAEGKDYKIVETGGNGQWCQYQYDIYKSLFSDEGKYIIDLYSVDAAGNINENIDDSKKAEISFGIDRTAPVIMPVDFETGKTYAVESKKVTMAIKDNLVLAGVKIYLNGSEVKDKVDGENYTFSIPNYNSAQNVKVVAVDAAGNSLTKEIKNFYVTTNLFVRWYTNTPLFVGSFIGLGVLIIGIVSIVLFHKKGKHEKVQ